MGLRAQPEQAVIEDNLREPTDGQVLFQLSPAKLKAIRLNSKCRLNTKLKSFPRCCLSGFQKGTNASHEWSSIQRCQDFKTHLDSLNSYREKVSFVDRNIKQLFQ